MLKTLFDRSRATHQRVYQAITWCNYYFNWYKILTMSGWHPDDKYEEEDVGDENPAVNNITVGGYLPCDMVPSPRIPF